jgi:hypothetical protein
MPISRLRPRRTRIPSFSVLLRRHGSLYRYVRRQTEYKSATFEVRLSKLQIKEIKGRFAEFFFLSNMRLTDVLVRSAMRQDLSVRGVTPMGLLVILSIT